MQKKTQRFDARQTMHSETYEVFDHVDANTNNLDAHYHDFYEFYFFVGDEVDYWINGNVYHLQSGDILIIEPYHLHKPIPVSENAKYERIVLWVNRNYLFSLSEGIFIELFSFLKGSLLLRPSTNEKNKILLLAQELSKEFYSSDFAAKSICDGILLQYISTVGRIALNENSKINQYSTPTFISEILTYINEHFCEKLSLDELAEHFFINKYYLSHSFKKAVGTSVYRYITLKRLDLANEMLKDNIPSLSVAEACGFKDYTSFFRAFKAEYGVSPTSIKPD